MSKRKAARQSRPEEASPAAAGKPPQRSIEPTSRLEWILLASLVLLTLGLRLARLDAYPVHQDEIRSFVAMKSLVETGLPLTDTGHLYWRALVAHSLMALPFFWSEPTIQTARLVPVVFSALVLVAVFLMGRSVEDRWAGLIAALFLAFSVFQERFAIFARFYLPFQFFFLCTVYFAGRYFILREARAGAWLLISYLAALGSGSLAVLALPIFGLAMLVGWRVDLRRSWRFIAGAMLVALAVYAVRVYRPPNAYTGSLSALATLGLGDMADKWFFVKLFRDFAPLATTLLILGLAPMCSRADFGPRRRLAIFYYGAFLGSLLVLSLVAPAPTRRYMTNLFPLGVLLASVSLVWWSKLAARLRRERFDFPGTLPKLATAAVVGAAAVCAVSFENWSARTAFVQRIPVVDEKPAHDVLAQRLEPDHLVISLAPSVTELHLGRRADFGLREKIDRKRGRWGRFTPQEKNFYSVPIIDSPAQLERILARSDRVWLYANWKLFKGTSRETQEVIARHFSMVYRPEDGSTGSALLLKD